MMKSLSTWLSNKFEQPTDNDPQHRVELATAVLLHEIVRADNNATESETQTFEKLLQQHFALSPDELTALTQDTHHHVEHAADFVQFTRIINEHCSVQTKVTILQGLWHVAYADGELAPNEEHLIRKVSDLLYISHKDFIQTKLKAQEKLN